jgi:riboflavin kinase / FMN adenylyltransferase
LIERFCLAMINDVHSDLTIFDFDNFQPLPFQDSLVTLGNFDGVHLGHQAIISRLVEKARSNHQPVIVVTFYPNPSVYFKRREAPYYLLSPGRKEKHLLDLGVDDVITFRFDGNFASLTPVEFLTGLKENLDMSSLMVGHDFALGKNRQGTIPVIREIGKMLLFDLEIIEPVIISEQEVSSTLIRRSLEKGDVRTASKMLGRPYSISGEVSHGSDRGSRIGLPTANLSHWHGKKLPAVGVYATHIELRGKGIMA